MENGKVIQDNFKILRQRKMMLLVEMRKYQRGVSLRAALGLRNPAARHGGYSIRSYLDLPRDSAVLSASFHCFC